MNGARASANIYLKLMIPQAARYPLVLHAECQTQRTCLVNSGHHGHGRVLAALRDAAAPPRT
eukprot:1773563-Pleurochrysis_carterae.AAC.1